jgi:hypothetical protein
MGLTLKELFCFGFHRERFQQTTFSLLALIAESLVERRGDRVTCLLVERNDLLRDGRNVCTNPSQFSVEERRNGRTGTGDTKLGVHLLVGTRSSERVETKLLVRVLSPPHGLRRQPRQYRSRDGSIDDTHSVSLDREDGSTVREDTEPVLPRLLVKDLERRHRDDPDVDALGSEQLGTLEDDGHLGSSRDEGDVGLLGVQDDVSSVVGLLDRRAGELGEVLARKADDGRGASASERHIVGGTGLVSICTNSSDELNGEDKDETHLRASTHCSWAWHGSGQQSQ